MLLCPLSFFLGGGCKYGPIVHLFVTWSHSGSYCRWSCITRRQFYFRLCSYGRHGLWASCLIINNKKLIFFSYKSSIFYSYILNSVLIRLVFLQWTDNKIFNNANYDFLFVFYIFFKIKFKMPHFAATKGQQLKVTLESVQN